MLYTLPSTSLVSTSTAFVDAVASAKQAAKFIDPSITYLSTNTTFFPSHPYVLSLLKWSLWSFYWFFQSLVGGGIFCIGHDAGHGTLSNYQLINHTIGYIAHTFILSPYWAWRHSHRYAIYRMAVIPYL